MSGLAMIGAGWTIAEMGAVRDAALPAGRASRAANSIRPSDLETILLALN